MIFLAAVICNFGKAVIESAQKIYLFSIIVLYLCERECERGMESQTPNPNPNPTLSALFTLDLCTVKASHCKRFLTSDFLSVVTTVIYQYSSVLHFITH